MFLLRIVFWCCLLLVVASAASVGSVEDNVPSEKTDGVVDNNIEDNAKVDSNDIGGSSNDSSSEPPNKNNSDEQISKNLNSVENIPKKDESEKNTSDGIGKDKPDEPDIPVNERFPHALQFGSTCGGSIISPTWVLTAGHCAMSYVWNDVMAGTNNSRDMNAVFRNGKRIVIHPLFSVGPHFLEPTSHNIRQIAARWDFLLVELEEPLPLDDKILAAVTLNEEKHLPPGLKVAYAGYGADEHDGYMTTVMHARELEVLDDAVCREKLIEYNPEDMVCTRGRAPRYDSACNGDSGSGLVDENGKLVGVASWVEDDAIECRNGTLVIFSRVSAVRDWIREVTGI